MTEAAPAISARQLEVRYARGAQAALAGVDLALPRGGGLLVTGPPGSGKTSLLRAILGLVPADGDLSVLGGAPGDPAVARRIGYAPQGRPVEPRLSAREIALLVARARGAAPGEADAALEAVGLADASRRSGRLDPEELRRLTLACARLGAPDLLVLDDPWEMPETVETIAEARGRGAAVLVACEEPGALAGLADGTLALSGGQGA